MQVLVAGATGAIGRQLLPLLTSAGHDVVGLAHSHLRTAAVSKAGASLVVADLLDRSVVMDAVKAAAPDAVVFMAAAIPANVNPRGERRTSPLHLIGRSGAIDCDWRPWPSNPGHFRRAQS